MLVAFGVEHVASYGWCRVLCKSLQGGKTCTVFVLAGIAARIPQPKSERRSGNFVCDCLPEHREATLDPQVIIDLPMGRKLFTITLDKSQNYYILCN